VRDGVLRIFVDGAMCLEHDVSHLAPITTCYSETGAYLPVVASQATEYDTLSIAGHPDRPGT
jgi:hypothetical protein